MRKLMQPIPISAAQEIAEKFGYDQVVIIARKVGLSDVHSGEHVTTYGVDKAHCDVAARIGNFLKFTVMGWVAKNVVSHELPETKNIEVVDNGISVVK